jgi:FHS family glucose/mannose:H+ symporter-like MFS transporter
MTTSSAPGTPKAGTQRGDRTIVSITIAACLIFWVFVFSDSGWGPILTPLSIQLHVSLVTVGLFYVLWSTGYLPGALVGGAMLDRYGPRRVLFGAALIIFCGILFIFVGLLLPRFMPLGVLLAIAGLAGTGGGVIDAATNGVISATFARRRGMALNLFNLLYPLGGVLVALVDAGLLTLFHNDPRPAFLFTLCFLVVALFSLLGIPASYRVETQVGPERLQGSPTLPTSLQLVDDTAGAVEPGRAIPLFVTLTPVIVVMVFTAGISSTVRAWAPSYLHVAFGQTPAIAAVLSSITWALSALSRLGAAALILRIGSWRMVILGILLTLLGLVSMMLSPNAVIATLAIALTAIGLSPLFATCLAIGSERAGRSPGSVAGVLLFMSGISTVFCSWFFGFLLNMVEPLWAVVFCFTFVLMGGLMALRLH